MVNHFRDAHPGQFYRHKETFEGPLPQPDQTPAFLRFATKHGMGLSLWKGEGASARDLVGGAGLHWPVMRREMVVPASPGLTPDIQVKHYYALVRPDTEQVMSVVTSAYAPAENQWVAEAVENYASRIHPQSPMIAAVGFGRTGDRTLFAARVTGDDHDAICLLAYNSHGGEGAIRFQLVEVDRERQITCVLDTRHASRTFAHLGDLQNTLRKGSSTGKSFLAKYLEETTPLWERLENTLWTRRHTSALIKELWGDTPSPKVGNGLIEAFDDVKARHPGHHLPDLMESITDAASAYRAICDWIDNRSEACERGDFTKDRTERLALGAGNKYKRDAWRWIRDYA